MTQPSNFAGYPAFVTAPSFIVLNNNFTNLIGFTPGTYGGGSVDSSTMSFYTPQGSVVNSVVVRCSLVSNNNCGFPSDILGSFPINAQFGSNITYDPSFKKWLKVKSGTYNNIITFVDQNFNTITILDSNVCITLLIKQ
jgi:hypothetical protein